MKNSEEGIVLKRINFSETSQVVTLLTRSKGVKTFLYKGGKKKKTALYPLQICEFNSYQRNESSLALMSDFHATDKTSQLMISPVKGLLAFFFADIILNCIPVEEEDDGLFRFISNWIKVINESEDLSILPTVFLAQLINHIGYAPDIQENARSFDIKNGEFLSFEKQDGYCVYGQECEQLLNLFNNEAFDPIYRHKMLNVLIDFCTIHIPKFNVSKSLEIVTTVLHD